MGKQKTTSIIETEEGELVGNQALARVAIKIIPGLIDDLIDELDTKNEREVIKRYICEPPLYDKERNSINYISHVMHLSRYHINKIIKRFKGLVWRKING